MCLEILEEEIGVNTSSKVDAFSSCTNNQAKRKPEDAQSK